MKGKMFEVFTVTVRAGSRVLAIKEGQRRAAEWYGQPMRLTYINTSETRTLGGNLEYYEVDMTFDPEPV